jgi:preprotein translocase subunit SecE
MTQASETQPNARRPRADGGPSRLNVGERLATYNRQVVGELRKVIWPTRNELVTYTAVSVTFVVFMVALVALFDFLFTKLVFGLFG